MITIAKPSTRHEYCDMPKCLNSASVRVLSKTYPIFYMCDAHWSKFMKLAMSYQRAQRIAALNIASDPAKQKGK